MRSVEDFRSGAHDFGKGFVGKRTVYFLNLFHGHAFRQQERINDTENLVPRSASFPPNSS